MKLILMIGIITLLLISGCESSYDDCKYDCLDFCMEGKEYKKWFDMGLREEINLWSRATPECRDNCYNECKPK